MATSDSLTASLPASLPSGPPRRSLAVRIAYYGFCFLLLALFIVVWWLYAVAHSALPQLDGKLTVPGLSAKVSVVRDEHGVPTIAASTLEDLFFAQGYVTAQDRLWQMDMIRRAAAGDLSEAIGEATVKFDREQRILGLRQAAEFAETKIPANERPYFDAYTRGVNAFMESHRDRLSLEFRLLKYQPKPWTVTDSLLVGARMVQDLNHYSYRNALTREKILAKLGPELTADLYVNSSWRDRPPTETRGMDDDPAARNGDMEDDDDDDNDGDEEIDPEGGSGRLISAITHAGEAPQDSYAFRPGSNDWVVSGQHTVTGKPLLSNDMHLTQQMPNLWFEAHLKTTDGKFDVAGVTLPGVPFVIVGHNQRIGWGFTNVGPTVEDDFIEEFNAQGQYKTPRGWMEPQHRRETIHIKGQPDFIFDVVSSRHGPIITELIPGETRKIALRWTLQDGEGLVFFAVDAAQNWDEFRKAFSTFGAPGQNVMYGDIDGHIGYQATGRVPIRAAGDGNLPVSGADDAHDWRGWIPFDDMPHVYDPPEGILATANGRIAPTGYKRSISDNWDGPWRTERIYRVLESGKQFAPADMLALQMDISSAYDRFCADKFVYAIDHAAHSSDRAKKATEILLDWDGRMSADSAAPTIETRAREELVRLLLEPKLGEATGTIAGATSRLLTNTGANGADSGQLSWKSYQWAMSSVWLENVLTKQPARWLPAAYPDYGSLLSAALEDAVKQPTSPNAMVSEQNRAPADLSQWKWGEYYPIEIKHPVLGRLPLIGRLAAPGKHPLSGSHFTVKQVGREFGPSERLTTNFANFDESTLNLVTGESGIFLSPYYLDQWDAWYEGSTFVFPFTQAAIEKHRQHELTMEPR